MLDLLVPNTEEKRIYRSDYRDDNSLYDLIPLVEKKKRYNLSRYEEGGNIEISAIQGSGKTLTAVQLVLHFVIEDGYQPEKVISNVKIDIPGIKFVSNRELRKWVDRIYRTEIGKHRRYIIVADEIEGIYSHRINNDQQMNDEIKGLFQDLKLGNYFIYTDHLGKGVNKLIRDVTEYTIIPDYDRETDKVKLAIINGLFCQTFFNEIKEASKIIPFYNRYDVTK